MISNSNSSVKDIVDNLPPIEKAILYECGKMHISINKNVNGDTLKKKLPNKYHKDFSKAIKNLLHKGYLVTSRPHNYGVPQEGRVIINYILEERQNEIYKGLRILIVID